MEFTIDAHCFGCGYDTNLWLGGGMNSFEWLAAWPVACRHCSAVTTANFKALPLVCQTCQSIDVVKMTDPMSGTETAKSSKIGSTSR